MSIHAVSWALSQDIDSPAVKLLLVAICNYADEDWQCWPSQEALAEDTSMSVRSVHRHMKELEARGYLHKESRRSKKGSRITDLLTIISQPDTTGQNEQPDNLSPDNRGSNNRTTVSDTYKDEPSKNHQKRVRARAKNRAPAPALIVVEKGSPEFDAWIAYWQANNINTKSRARQDKLTVESPFPPERLSA